MMAWPVTRIVGALYAELKAEGTSASQLGEIAAFVRRQMARLSQPFRLAVWVGAWTLALMMLPAPRGVLTQLRRFAPAPVKDLLYFFEALTFFAFFSGDELKQVDSHAEHLV